MTSRFHVIAIAVCLFLATTLAANAFAGADPAPFDLGGPALEARVTRGGTELPIAEVPNLAPGDRIWVKADLPDSQSARYLLVLAFLVVLAGTPMRTGVPRVGSTKLDSVTVTP